VFPDNEANVGAHYKGILLVSGGAGPDRRAQEFVSKNLAGVATPRADAVTVYLPTTPLAATDTLALREELMVAV
jgi:hypothetical protein